MTRRKLPATTAPETPTATPSAPMRVAQSQLDQLAVAPATPATSLALAQSQAVDRQRYQPQERDAAAAAPAHAADYSLNRNAADALSFVDATGWPGFQNLALLAQLPEYRSMHEALADDVVRTWGKVTSTSEDPAAAEKVTRLSQKLDQLQIRNLIRTATIHDQAFGGAHVFPHLKAAGSDVPADSKLLLEPSFVTRGCLQSFSAVEPLWVTPNNYNATDPTKPDFYKPSSWYVLSREIHSSRLYTMISRPVSDLLKAAYSFRGVSLSQMAMPYVDNWLRTRQSVSDTVKQFSVTFLAADLQQMLQPGGAQSMMNRVQLFNLYRDNRNVGLIDKDTEEFGQVNTPLSGLDALQAQAQEQMSAVARAPLVKLLGITPAGLNANSDGEIRVWYDYVAGYQSHNLQALVLWILQLIQLSEFGEIDPALGWEWNPLYELTDVEQAEVRSKNADTDVKYIEAGVVAPEVVQRRLEQDPTSGYSALLAAHDELDEVNELAEQMLAEAAPPAPQEPQEPTDGQPDADQPDAQGSNDRDGDAVAGG